MPQLIRRLKDYPVNTAEHKSYSMVHEHVGEAVPVNKEGFCEHPFLVPNANRTLCIFPQRIDVGQHYLKSGGVDGLKEPYEVAVSRLQAFILYLFKLEKLPAVESLFQSPKFLKAARSVCPSAKQHLDPFQFNVIVQVPGQTVAMHLDAPYFWGAGRFQFPQWLLASMVFSGLFKERFVDQVQVVAYLHNWTDPENSRAGRFVYWADSGDEPRAEEPLSLAGSAVDGSKTVHAASVYYPQVRPPLINPQAVDARLSYAGDERWELRQDGKTLRSYDTDQLRFSIVYRARCFRHASEAEEFRKQKDFLSLEHVLDVFKDDLKRRGEEVETLSRMDLALRIMDTYVRYPLPPRALFPYNYCMASRIFPSLKPLLDLIC